MTNPATNSLSALSARRRKARHFAMQALYQWQMAGARPADIEAEFRTDNDMTHVDTEYFHELIQQIPRISGTLDNQIEPLLDRRLHELDPVSLALLRLATYELQQRPDVPFRVVINEAVALSKKFGPVDSYKFINGILDKLAPSLRAAEVAASRVS